jgi:hypothetical protein
MFKTRTDPAVLNELNRWWLAACELDDRDNDNLISHEEYSVFYHRLVYAFNHDDDDTNDIDMESAFNAQETDWEADSEGDGSVDKDDFLDCVFEFALTWADGVDHEADEEDIDLDPHEINTYLTKLYDAIFKPKWAAVMEYWSSWVGKKVRVKSTGDRGEVTEVSPSGMASILLMKGSTTRVKIGDLEEVPGDNDGGSASEKSEKAAEENVNEKTPWTETGEHKEHRETLRRKYSTVSHDRKEGPGRLLKIQLRGPLDKRLGASRQIDSNVRGKVTQSVNFSSALDVAISFERKPHAPMAKKPTILGGRCGFERPALLARSTFSKQKPSVSHLFFSTIKFLPIRPDFAHKFPNSHISSPLFSPYMLVSSPSV